MGSDRYWESQNNGALWYANLRRKCGGLADDWKEKARALNATSPLEAAGIRECARQLQALLEADGKDR